MKQVHERLKELRKSLNLSIREFSKQIYISHSLYGELELGHKKTTDKFIQLISSRFNVSKDWIKTGEGEMLTAPPPDIQLEKLIEIYNTLDGLLKECLLEQSDILLKIYKDKIKK
jgi:transcriptional regulator with XRE-family HTH domain